jgi:hypothetical protein
MNEFVVRERESESERDAGETRSMRTMSMVALGASLESVRLLARRRQTT